MKDSKWDTISCEVCGGPLYGTRHAAVPYAEWAGMFWVHCDGWNRQTLEIKQVDRGHTPTVKVTAGVPS